MKNFGILLAVMIGLINACTKKSDQPQAANKTNEQATEVVIGEYGSFTGSEATFGNSTSAGIKMAIQEINSNGGIKGKQVRLVSVDTQSKNEEAPAAVERLITQNKVVAVIGEVASGRSILGAPVAQKYKVPMITPASTNPKVTEVGDYIFRTCFIDPFQGTVMAKFAFTDLKKKKVAVLRDIKAEYSVGLANYFTKTFEQLGGKIVADEKYQSGDFDFKAQLTKIKTLKPDAIFIPGYYTEVGLIAKQAKQLGLSVPLLGGDGWDSAKLYEIGKDAINGNFFSNHYTTESTEPVVQDFISKYKSVNNQTPPDAMSALGYDAAKILFAAMERAPELTTESIRNELAKTKDFPGVTGKITIDENRNAAKSAVVVKVAGKDFKYVTTISP